MSGRKTWSLLISDLLINLSAGWFGAALIVPTFSNDSLTMNLWILTMDMLLGTLFLTMSFLFRRGLDK